MVLNSGFPKVDMKEVETVGSKDFQTAGSMV